MSLAHVKVGVVPASAAEERVWKKVQDGWRAGLEGRDVPCSLDWPASTAGADPDTRTDGGWRSYRARDGAWYILPAIVCWMCVQYTSSFMYVSVLASRLSRVEKQHPTRQAAQAIFQIDRNKQLNGRRRKVKRGQRDRTDSARSDEVPSRPACLSIAACCEKAKGRDAGRLPGPQAPYCFGRGQISSASANQRRPYRYQGSCGHGKQGLAPATQMSLSPNHAARRCSTDVILGSPHSNEPISLDKASPRPRPSATIGRVHWRQTAMRSMRLAACHH